MPTVRYFHLPPGGVVERHVGITVVFGDWPVRVMKHRGWRDERQIHYRRATPAETEWLKTCRRFQSIFYRSAEQLLEDESALLDADELERLTRSLRIFGLLDTPAAGARLRATRGA